MSFGKAKRLYAITQIIVSISKGAVSDAEARHGMGTADKAN